MGLITWIYIINMTLLLLHEIESAYWKEWEILRLPGGITGFIIIHFPLIILLLLGLVELRDQTLTGFVFSLITGIAGIIPFLVHNVLVRVKGKFQLFISQFIIYLNLFTGIILSFLSFLHL
jgi:hypothetical protein